MRFLSSTFVLLLLFVGLTGCDDHDPAIEALETEAVVLHDSLLAIEGQVFAFLAQVDAAEAGAFAAPVLDSIEAIRTDLEAWSGHMVEPPGAHHEDHDHDHDHSHGEELNVTPQQMVELQQALLDEIAALHMRTEQLDLDALPPAPEEKPSEHSHDHSHSH